MKVKHVSLDKSPDQQHLRLYHLYRLCASGILLGSQLWPFLTQQTAVATPVFWAMLAYFLYAVCYVIGQRHWAQPSGVLLKWQIVIDIAYIIVMIHFLRQDQSGIDLLLIINLVFASLISDGRFSIFYSSIATNGLLLENTFQIIQRVTSDADYINAVLLSLCCYATAWLANTLVSRMQVSETLATQRGKDIEQLAKTNDLISREMPNGVLVINQHQHLMHYNLRAGYLLGLDDAVLADTVQARTPIDQLIPELVQVLHGRQSPLSTYHDALRLRMNNRDLGIRFHAISEDIENGVVIFIEDWSQIQTQAHQVKLAALGRLTANIAHEIRNPLSSISHATQLLQEDAADTATQRMLQIISDNVQRLDQIIKDVLELNRRDRTNQEVFSLNAFVQEFYQQFCAVEKIDLQHFTLALPADELQVYFDRRHINQILWNLCKNGWRHCRQQHHSLHLRIEKDKSGQFIHILVIDDGSGIDAKIQPHVFEPFMTTEKTGTGLGLYIARELAEANGAQLDYRHLSAGTQFSLTIKKAIL